MRAIKCQVEVGTVMKSYNPYAKLEEASGGNAYGACNLSIPQLITYAQEWGEIHIMGFCGSFSCQAAKNAIKDGVITYEQLGWTKPEPPQVAVAPGPPEVVGSYSPPPEQHNSYTVKFTPPYPDNDIPF